VASVRSCLKLPLCPTEPAPAGSKADLLLAKAEPISDGGSPLWDNVFQKGEKSCVTAIEEGEMNEKM